MAALVLRESVDEDLRDCRGCLVPVGATFPFPALFIIVARRAAAVALGPPRSIGATARIVATGRPASSSGVRLTAGARCVAADHEGTGGSRVRVIVAAATLPPFGVSLRPLFGCLVVARVLLLYGLLGLSNRITQPAQKVHIY